MIHVTQILVEMALRVLETMITPEITIVCVKKDTQARTVITMLVHVSIFSNQFKV